MADKRITEIRKRLHWMFGFALGAALAFAVILAVSALVIKDGNLVVWGSVFGFLVLVVIAFGLTSHRLSVMERNQRRSRNTGVLLAEQVARREQAEASLREEALFPQLNPGPVLRFDSRGRITRSNNAAKAFIEREDLETRTVQELVSEFGGEDVERCIRGEFIDPREVQWGERWFVCHFRSVPELSVGMVFASEITGQKQVEIELRDMESRTRAILDGAADAIIIVITGGIIQAVNPATQKLFDYGYDELVGRNMELLLPDLFGERGGDRLWILAEYSRRRPTGPVGRTIYGRKKDGTKFPVSLTVSVYEHDGIMRVSCIVRDITDRMRSDELQAQQAKKLKQQNYELERLVNELNEFNYVASHDLQEPLRTMSTYCGLLKADLGGDLPARAEEDVKAILDASLRMQRLITDLLEYSRSGHRELRAVEVDLNDVVQRVRKDLKARLDETGGRIDAEALPAVHGDEMQLGRVVQNLVSNGLKFKRPGESPVVTISGEKNGEHTTVEVRDNGIGIEEKYLGQIFKPFKRLHGVGKYEGSGIGLSVCRKIMERHGGSIDVASSPGEGSRFILRLPSCKPEGEEPAKAGEE